MDGMNLFGDVSGLNGLLPNEALANARNQGLLGMAAGLLQAGGPSLVKHSLGQALGAGFVQGQQGYQNSLHQSLQNQLAGMQAQQLRNNLMLNNWALSHIPGVANSQGNAAPSANAAANTTGAAPSLAPSGNGAVGGTSTATPSGQTAGLSNTTAQNNQAPTGQAQPTPAQAKAGDDFTIPGMSTEQSVMMFVRSPDKYFEAMNKANELPQFAKDLRAAGIDYNSPIGRSIAQQYIYKTYQYIAPLEVRGGNTVLDPITNKPKFFNPSLPDGAMPIYDTNGNVVAARAIPGAAGVKGTMAQAEAVGRTMGTLNQGVDANGAPTYFMGVPPGVAGGVGGSAAPVGNAAPKANTGAPTAPNTANGQQPSAPTVRPGLSATQKLLTDQGAEYYKSAVNEAQNVNQHRQVLNEISRLAADPNNTFGPGSEAFAKVMALGKNIGIDFTGAQTSQDIMKKLASNLTMSQLGAGGATGTDAQLHTLISANPNGNMTNEAILKVVPLLGQQLDMREARANVLNKAVGPEGNAAVVPGTLQQFNRLATPGAITLGRQLAAATANGTLKDFKAKLTPQQTALLPTVYKLDAMGAF